MHRRAFTLIELLVTIGVVAILSVVVVLVVNPVEILRQSRDSVRLSDVKVIDGMVSAYQQAIGGSLGTPGVTYVSIPDPTATSSAGTDCTGVGAPFTGGGAFHCAAPSNLRKADGTGWIPVNLAAAPDGLSIGALPVDPINTTSSNQYYFYQTDGSTYKIMALPESQTYTPTVATNAALFIRGTNLALGVGTYLSQFGSSGSGNGQFSHPWDVAIAPNGNIYVPDPSHHRVEEFDSSGNYLSQFGSSGTGNGQFNYPYGIAIDASGNVYVADTNNNNVQKFDSSGNYLSQFGSVGTASGTGNGQFDGPYGIAIAPNGNIYVADQWNARVQEFSSSGTYLSQFGSSGPGIVWPASIAIDANGNIYVADYGVGFIKKFDSNGNYLSQLGSMGSGDGQFQGPNGIAIDGSGHIYVSDVGDGRVEEFDSSGNYLSQFAASAPNGLATDASRNVYVAEYGSHHVVKFEGDQTP